MDSARAHLRIRGRVQGVSFRAFTRSIAMRLGLSGWVRNLPDGRVEAVLEGSRDSVEKAIAECNQGPPGSRVTGIELEWENFSGNLKGFEIKY